MNAGTVNGRDPSQQYSEVHPKQSFSGNLHLDPTTCLAVPRAPILNPEKFSCSATRRESRVQNRCDSAAPALGASLGLWAHDGRIRSRSFGAGASSGADRPGSRQEPLVCCCYPLASRRQPTSLLACPRLDIAGQEASPRPHQEAQPTPTTNRRARCPRSKKPRNRRPAWDRSARGQELYKHHLRQDWRKQPGRTCSMVRGSKV
jgi:hypothetical protein